MSFLLLLPAIVSLLLLGAHTMRLEMPVLMAIPVAVLLLLCWPHRWVARLALFTLLSSLVFRTRTLRCRYRPT